MSESVGAGLASSSVEADMIWPDWQERTGAPSKLDGAGAAEGHTEAELGSREGQGLAQHP